ncbi:hypothetical protein CANARDRAFT_30381 [[Candida] arabinofermentans NRRL YB-2248]|uniref:DNA replication complex GINS protein PSF3 n=1 Tax=[Candida] arabinofermentans NRRL YB-2248 TaxID=983967 RepID=A0A1E4SU57_9ASCO|nr:hypothetical protein CANARDRAFT_30381 [[Candida] arabinofermentans NRRL YB-2248]
MSYYDVDDILADSIKLPCKFSITIPGLGYLNNQPLEPIQKNLKLDLPIWLAEILAVCSINDGQDNDDDDDNNEEDEDETFLKLILPIFLSPQYLNLIKSSPLKPNLAQIGYYYKIVNKWCYLFNDEELVELISKLIVDRCCEINDLGYRGNLISGEFVESLDEWEKILLKNCLNSGRDFKNWWLKDGTDN